jgi:hypothetical protein
MYLWNTKALRAELRSGALPQRERMKYYLVFVVLSSIAAEVGYYVPQPVTAPTIAGSFTLVLGSALGTYLTYRVNRRGDDREFIDRSVCLGLPIIVRLLTVATPVLIAYLSAGSFFGGEAFDQFAAHTTWVDVAFGAAFLAVFYWRLALHLSFVSKSDDLA